MIRLEKLDPDEPVQVAELRRQRVLCGWDEDQVDSWLDLHRRGLKTLFWIFPDYGSNELYPVPAVEPMSLRPLQAGPPPASVDFQPIGHAALSSVDNRGEPSDQESTGSVALGQLFVLRSQQGRGLGNLVMDVIESMARSPAFSALEVLLDTMPASDALDPKFWAKFGITYDPAARVNQHWYERRGYVVFDTRSKVSLNRASGQESKFDVVYMRKML